MAALELPLLPPLPAPPLPPFAFPLFHALLPMFCTVLPDTVAFNVDVAATVVFHVDELLVEFDVSFEVVVL
ncbi:MAG: hypothetical protein ACLQO1_01465 [Steroidobacteraceae bacterium]